MISIISAILICTGFFFICIGISMSVSIKRAQNNKPYSVKHGMYLDRKTNKLVGTETDVMYDPKTGIEWYGETRKLNG